MWVGSGRWMVDILYYIGVRERQSSFMILGMDQLYRCAGIVALVIYICEMPIAQVSCMK